MENKMIRWFVRLFFLICVTFIVCLLIQLNTLVKTGSTWVSWYYFLWVLPTPLLGYLMMRFGEYMDSRKKY